jgi:predicted Zn finger-like uncharacterized protein
MIVRCPSCKTAYRVADDVTQNATPVFRCSRCKHTFELDPRETPAEPVAKARASDQPASAAKDDQELSFTFPAKQQEDAQDRKDSIDAAIQDYELAVPSDATAKPWSLGAEESSLSSDPHDSVESPKHVDSATDIPHQVSPSQPLPLSRESTANILSLDPYRDQAASIVPYLTLLALLLISFAFVTALHFAHPEASEGIVKAIPWVGPSVLKNNNLKNGVVLQSLRASLQTIQGNREVIVVTGVAANQNPVVIREVRVAGQLYNLDGKEIEQQAIWIGNAISPRIIRGMTAQDISDLQRLKPLKSFEMPPGDSIPFTIVFLKSTKGITDFSCAVLAAEDQA